MLAHTLRRIKQRGVMFVEYAVLLAFVCVAGVVFLDSSGIPNSIKGVFAKVDQLFGGETDNSCTIAERIQQKMKELYYTELSSGGWYINEKEGPIDQKIKLGEATIVMSGVEYPLYFGRGVVSNKREPVENYIKNEFGTNGYLTGFNSTTAESLREMMAQTTNIDTYTAGIKLITMESGDKLENGTIPVTQYLFYRTKEDKNTVYKVYGTRTGFMSTDAAGNVQKRSDGTLDTNKTVFYADSSKDNKLEYSSGWNTSGY